MDLLIHIFIKIKRILKINGDLFLARGDLAGQGIVG